MRKILLLVFVLVLGLLAASVVFADNPGNDCQGSSCEDVPGQECEHQAPENNPHCDGDDQDDDEDDDDEDENGHTPVDVCHVTGNGWMELTVDNDAVDGHLGHGDFVIDEDHPCPPSDDDDGGDDGDDNGGNITQTHGNNCVDIFHPFLAVAPYSPAAQAFVVNDAVWAGPNTDLTNASYVRIRIVPADYDETDRDTIRDGNDAGILCLGVLEPGPQIVAYVMPDGSIAGLVLVQQIDDSIVILQASILRWDILTPDPLWGGVWNYGS